MTCPACDGEATLLGTLGALDWYRCRQCGAEWHSSERLDALVLDEPEDPRLSPDPGDNDWREP